MVYYLNKGNKNLYEFGIYNPLLNKKQMDGVKNMVKAKVQDTIKLEDGKHTGVVKELIEKKEPYHYLDIVITEKETDFDLKCGVPLYISENSALGKILINFGATLEVDSDLEVDDFIKSGQKVEFTTVTEETKKGNFARIQPQTIKPIK